MNKALNSNNERNLQYWYSHTSMLGFARMIRNKLPLRLKLFTKIYVDIKDLDTHSGIIRVYYSYKSYAEVYKNERFCYEFTLEDFERESNGKPYITGTR